MSRERPGDTAAPVALRTVEDLLYREAQLADEHRFDEWLALWDDRDILYWVPCNDGRDPSRSVSITYDDRTRLEDRLYRLKRTAVHAQHPRSRMRRLISNTVIEAPGEDEMKVAANFVLLELRGGRQSVLGGRYEYALRRRSGRLCMAQKKVLLTNNNDFLGNLTFLL